MIGLAALVFLKMRMEVVVAFVVWLLRMNICISMYLMTAENYTCDPYHHRYQTVVSISDTSRLCISSLGTTRPGPSTRCSVVDILLLLPRLDLPGLHPTEQDS